jgi:hypothetical protein
MLMIYVFLIVVAVVLAAVGALGLMTTISLNVVDRRASSVCCARSADRRQWSVGSSCSRRSWSRS